MLTTYIVGAIACGAMLLASAFYGFLARVDEDGGSFGPRFWTAALGAFGVAGMTLTWARVLQEPLRAVIAVGVAIVVGVVADRMYLQIASRDASDEAQLRPRM